MCSQHTSAFIVLTILIAGCNQATTGTFVTPAPDVENKGPAPSEEECQRFAVDLEAAVLAADEAKLRSLLRLDDLMLRSVSDIDLPAEARGTIRQKVAQGEATSGTKLPAVLIATVKDGGSYKFRKYHLVEGKPHVLFRMLRTDGAVNYHDIAVARHADGQVAMEDIYVLMTGERISQTIRRLLIPVMAGINRSLVSRLTKAEVVYIENMDKLQQMAVANLEGRHEKTISVYHSLPSTLRKDKSVLMLYLMAAQAKGDEEYDRALEVFRSHHPADAALDLAMLDHHFANKRFDVALKCLDRLDGATQGDSYILALRANTLVEQGRYKEAAAAAEKAIEQEPDLHEAYSSRLAVSLKTKNHDGTFHWLCRYVEKCGIDIVDLAAQPDYADFVKSPKYDEWKKWYEKRTKK